MSRIERTKWLALAFIYVLCGGCHLYTQGDGTPVKLPFYSLDVEHLSGGEPLAAVYFGKFLIKLAGSRGPGPDPIPERARVIWMSSTGRVLQAYPEVARFVPNMWRFKGKIMFQLYDDRVRAVPLDEHNESHDRDWVPPYMHGTDGCAMASEVTEALPWEIASDFPDVGASIRKPQYTITLLGHGPLKTYSKVAVYFGKFQVVSGSQLEQDESSHNNYGPEIPVTARVIWMTPDGNLHEAEPEVARLIPDIEHFKGELFFELLDNRVRVVPASGSDVHSFVKSFGSKVPSYMKETDGWADAHELREPIPELHREQWEGFVKNAKKR